MHDRCEDNGPGIVRKQVEHIFGRLLYGSKFHRLKMSRGQQGIGISAAGMYGLMTTGKPMVIISKTSKKNESRPTEVDAGRWTPPRIGPRSPRTSRPRSSSSRSTPAPASTIVARGELRHAAKSSVEEYLGQTAIANPHTADRCSSRPSRRKHGEGRDETLREITYALRQSDWRRLIADDRDGRRTIVYPAPSTSCRRRSPRRSSRTPTASSWGRSSDAEASPMRDAARRVLLKKEFCRVPPAGVARRSVTRPKLTTRTWVKNVGHPEAETERLYSGAREDEAPHGAADGLPRADRRPHDARGDAQRRATRSSTPRRRGRPAVYRAEPVPDRGADRLRRGPCRATSRRGCIRFANRVPLLYQQSACSVVQGRDVDTSLAELRAQPAAGASLPVGAAGRDDPHGERVGAVHERERRKRSPTTTRSAKR